MKRNILLIIIFCIAVYDICAQEAISKSDSLSYTDYGGQAPGSERNTQPVKKDTIALVFDTTGVEIPMERTGERQNISENKMNITSATLVAGSVTGSLDISASGGATYTVPIQIPPGINGFVPQLALTYNSQGGNGVAGYGWNITGLSAITRIPSTLFHDGVMDPVNYNVLDRFTLDGQRLLAKTGIYGMPGTEYVTENNSNIRIFSRQVPGGSGSDIFFEVWYPNGIKAFYGETSTSRTTDNYGISSTQNLDGAVILFNYTNSGNALFIQNIQYGGKINSTQFNTITFTYANSVAKEVSYTANTSFLSDKILNKISITANGVPYKNYQLTHQQISPFQYQNLVKVQELNGDETEELDPLIFTYPAPTAGISYTSPINVYLGSGGTSISATNYEVITHDFTGNGIMDMIVYHKDKNKFNCFWDPERNSTNPEFGKEVTGAFTEIFPANILYHNNTVSSNGIYVVRPENSGQSFKFSVYAAGSSYATITGQYEKEWYAPLTPVFITGCHGNPAYGGEPIPMRFISGDFDGDGLTDIIAVSHPYSYVSDEHITPGDPDYCYPIFTNFDYSESYFVNMKRGNEDEPIYLGGFVEWVGSNDVLKTADFNGDGKMDILHVKGKNLYVYEVNTLNQLVLLFQGYSDKVAINLPILTGDYNGDGKADIMMPAAGEGNDRNLYVHFYSTGSSFKIFEKRHSFNYDFPKTENGYNYIYSLMPTDLNNDGKTDILYTRTKTSNGSTSGEIISIPFYNSGMPNVNTAHDFINGGLNTRSATIANNPIPVVMNSKDPNFKLEFGFISHNVLTLFNYLRDARKETTLKTINQSGILYTLDYKEATANYGYDPHEDAYGATYTSNSLLTYPYNNLIEIPGFHLLRKIKREVPTLGTTYQVFNYENATTHLTGLGFTGFGRTSRSNWHTDEFDENKIHSVNFYDPLNRGLLAKSFTSKSSNVSSTVLNVTLPDPDVELSAMESNVVEATKSVTLLPGFEAGGTNGDFIAKITDAANGIDDAANPWDYITRTDYTYDTELLPNKVFRSVPTSVATKDILSGTNTLKTFEYDTYYNVSKEETSLSGQGTQITEVTYDNNPGNTNYYIGRPLTKKTTANNGGDIFTTEEEYTYTGHLPTQIKRKGHGTPFITENLQYDSYGNVTQKTLVTADGQRTTSSTYDASGRFMASQTDADGMTNSYTYNQSTGNVLTKTNPYSQTESYDYDTWGRLVETTNYLGKKSYRAYIKSGTDIHITESDEEGNEGLKIINALGQTLQTAGKDLTGQWVNKQQEYDVYGRLKKESEPYTSTANQWNETEYDEYGRVNQTTSYTGKAANITYSGLSITVNDGTKSVTTTKNALGQVVSVQDPGGNISYTYDAAGNMKTANYDGSVQSISYDGWGRKIQLTDPSAGNYYYEYNDFGELTHEVTPKGATTYSYDAAGKLISKTLTGDLTNMGWQYSYNNTTKLLEQLTLTNADGNNAVYTYTYDSYKRPASVVENNLHAIFTKSFSYDAFGRVATETSQAQDKASNRTAGRTLEYHYQNGGLLKVTDQATGTRIHEISSLNARGQVINAVMGASLKQSDSYDSYGLPQNFITQKLGGTTTDLMNLGYSFNAERGLLNSRSNSTLSWNETFTYDNLDRLTAFNDNNGNNSHTYDSRGRITNNSQLGDYYYTGSSYQQNELINPTPLAESWYQDRSLQQISYNAFKSPVEINEDGKEIISFRYNAAMQRAHMYYGDTETNAENRRYRRHYSEDGSMEITNDTQTGTTSFVFYLGGDAYSAPAIWKEVQTAVQTTANLYFLHRDHLGSIVLITDDAGNVAEKRQFDAWGNIVKLEDGLGNPLTAFVILDRGYTGHEHLLGVALIHMNGRLYDPKLHRFLSPDNYVQDPYNTQNFNRYGYVLNNPLSHVDPSGEIAWLVPVIIFVAKAAATGAAIAAAGYTASVAFSKGGFDNWNWSQFGKSVSIGAISGVATAGVGAVFGHATTTLLNEVGRGLVHGVVNGGISEFTGGNFLEGFASGSLGSLAGSAFQAWLPNIAGHDLGMIGFSAVSGGVGAELTGGDFWRGAAVGATVATLNHLGGKILGNDPTQKTLDDLKATSEAIGYTADGATIYMGMYKGEKFYYTNINGNIKWIPTSKITSVISKFGKGAFYTGLVADGLAFTAGKQSGIQTIFSMSWAGGTALMKLGLRGNVFSGLLYNALFTDFAQPTRPIYYRAPFGLPDNTKVVK